MTTNTATRNMSDEVGIGRITTSDKGEQHYTLERDGCRCQVCGALGYPHDGDDRAMFVYPLGKDVPPTSQITVCNECLVSHTEQQLDEYVAEMQERRRALKENPGDYEQNRERAFERDDHTCQLCGQEGFPKTERGLVAYPVCAGDYHLDNLVTICNDCITDTLDSDEDDQKAADRLRLQAARAKEWITSDEADAEQGENIDGHR